MYTSGYHCPNQNEEHFDYPLTFHFVLLWTLCFITSSPFPHPRQPLVFLLAVYISFACFRISYKYFVWLHSLRIMFIYQYCLLWLVFFCVCSKKSLPTWTERIHSPMWVEDKPQCDWSNQSYAKVPLENTTGLRNKWEETGEAWEGPRGRTGLQGSPRSQGN